MTWSTLAHCLAITESNRENKTWIYVAKTLMTAGYGAVVPGREDFLYTAPWFTWDSTWIALGEHTARQQIDHESRLQTVHVSGQFEGYRIGKKTEDRRIRMPVAVCPQDSREVTRAQDDMHNGHEFCDDRDGLAKANRFFAGSDQWSSRRILCLICPRLLGCLTTARSAASPRATCPQSSAG